MIDQAVQQIADGELTDRMARLALRLLARAKGGHVSLRRETLRVLFDVGDDSSVRKYLARMRRAGILDYRAGRESVAIWFVAWVEADDRQRRAGRRPAPLVELEWMPAAANGASRAANGAAQAANGATKISGAAPWDR